MNRIICDIGGTKMRIAKSLGDGFSEPVVIDTPKDYEEGIKTLTEEIKKLNDGSVAELICGLPGILNKEKKSLFNATNLPLWVDKDIVGNLQGSTGISNTKIYNDTSLVGLGEAVYGAGKGKTIVAYITVSTGVGGVRIVNKEIDNSHYGFEPGHQIVDIDGSSCPECYLVSHNGVGHLDNLVSGKAMEEKLGKSPKDIEDSNVWSDYARNLSVGLYNSILHWSPDVVVLGGSMIVGDPAIDISEVKRNLDELLKVFPEVPEIKKAELGDFGGLWGGLVV